MLREGRESLSRERCCETHELSRKSDGSYRTALLTVLLTALMGAMSFLWEP